VSLMSCHKTLYSSSLALKSCSAATYHARFLNEHRAGTTPDASRQRMGSACEVTFEFVGEIDASGSGKYRYAICEVG